MTIQLVPPAHGGDGFKAANHNGQLVVIQVQSVEKDVRTVNGPSDAVRGNVTVIDYPGGPKDYDNTLVFGSQIVNACRGQEGKAVFGRIIQGQAQPGKNPPWLLAAPTEQDFAQAQQWAAWKMASAFTTPAAIVAPQPSVAAPVAAQGNWNPPSAAGPQNPAWAALPENPPYTPAPWQQGGQPYQPPAVAAPVTPAVPSFAQPAAAPADPWASAGGHLSEPVLTGSNERGTLAV